jgi:HAD superfamily phosphatase (TIGR01668 family)
MNRWNQLGRQYLRIGRELVMPDAAYASVEMIPLGALAEQGYDTLLLDVDNTLLTRRQRYMSLQKSTWIEQVKKQGFRVFLVSNNSSKKRVCLLCDQVQVMGTFFSLKPFTFSIRSLAHKYGFDPRRSVVVGDQILTDVVAGNWVGAYTVWVEPIDRRLSLLKTIQRDFETHLLRFFDTFK